MLPYEGQTIWAVILVALVHFLWQGTLVAVATAAIAGLCTTPALRHRVFVVGLVVMAACPIATLACRPAHTVAPFLGVSELHRWAGPLAPWQRLSRAAVAAYLLVVAAMFARLALGFWGCARARKETTPVRDPRILESLARQASRLGLRLLPMLAMSRRTAVPVVFGVLRPTILLPAALVAGLPIGQIEVILAHELAHLARHDHLVVILQRVVEAFLFFHPAVWWMSARIGEEREKSCDDLVIAGGGEPRLYADALVRTARLAARSNGNSAAWGLGLTATAAGSALARRVRRLVDATEPRTSPRIDRTDRPSFLSSASIAAVLLAVAGVAALQSPLPPRAPEAPGPAPEPFIGATVIDAPSPTVKPSASLVAQPDAASLLRRPDAARVVEPVGRWIQGPAKRQVSRMKSISPHFSDLLRTDLMPTDLLSAAGLLRLDRKPSMHDWEFVRRLSPEARTRMRPEGGYEFTSLTSLDVDDAAIIATLGSVRLPNLRYLSPEAAERLAAIEDSLSLPSLETISAEVARGLAAGRAALELAGIKAIDSLDAGEVAAALARRPGRVALPNLERITVGALDALAARNHLGRPHVELPPIESLEVIPDPKDEILPFGVIASPTARCIAAADRHDARTTRRA